MQITIHMVDPTIVATILADSDKQITEVGLIEYGLAEYGLAEYDLAANSGLAEYC